MIGERQYCVPEVEMWSNQGRNKMTSDEQDTRRGGRKHPRMEIMGVRDVRAGPRGRELGVEGLANNCDI